MMESTSMLAARTVQIDETDAGITVKTHPSNPVVAIPIFFLTTILLLGFIVLCGGGALGFISPETASPPIRIFAGLFAIIWTAIGIWTGPSMFRRAFAKSEFQATESSFCVRHTSFLGTSRKDYSWNQIEAFTEVVTGGEFNRDLAMIACGRHVSLDRSLSAQSAADAVAALSRCLDKYRNNCPNQKGRANRRHHSREEANRT